MGATEDAASRRPARPGGTSLIVKRALSRSLLWTAVRRRALLLLLSLLATAVVLGLVFAGSPTTIANGVTIDGIDVGGLQAKDARALLERRSAASAPRPVVFVAG